MVGQANVPATTCPLARSLHVGRRLVLEHCYAHTRPTASPRSLVAAFRSSKLWITVLFYGMSTTKEQGKQSAELFNLRLF